MNSLRKGYIILFLSFSIFSNLHAQTCDCKINLDALVHSIEYNYAGYDDKAAGTKSASYQKHKEGLYRKVNNISGYGCYMLLREYLQFFQDPHLKLRLANLNLNNAFNDTLRNMFKSFPIRQIKLTEIYQDVDTNNIDSIEGIWQALDFPFKLAILKDGKNAGKFIGVTLSADSIKWFRGQTKMEIAKVNSSYKIVYYTNDHLPDTVFAELKNGQFNLGPYGGWRRIYPENIHPGPKSESSVSFNIISPSVCTIVLKDGWISNRSILDSVINSNLKTITNTPYLIIDLRGNSGGHNMTYYPLYQFVYTKPIITDGLLLKSSKDNIDLYKQDLDDGNYSEEELKSIREMIQMMEQNIGKMTRIAESDSIVIPDVSEYPKKVAIITNRKTASASEMFILQARQSGKVMTFGERTRGELDYTDFVKPRADLPCPYIQYTCPIGTGDHKFIPLIDNVGIKPDVNLKGISGDWVKFVANYLEKTR